MRTARRAAEIEPFEVMDVLSRAQALERAGRRVVHMEIGEPDFTAPAPVVEAGVRALREGRTAYTAALGVHASARGDRRALPKQVFGGSRPRSDRHHRRRLGRPAHA